jgi:hypothetical protein
MAVLVLTMALLLSGCGAAGVAAQVEDGAPIAGCGSAQIEGGERVLSCADAIAAAELALGGLHWPISKATFDRFGMPVGVLCPANARCVPPTGGLVVFEFWFGEPVRYHVSLDAHGLATAEPAAAADEGVQVPANDEAPVP